MQKTPRLKHTMQKNSQKNITLDTDIYNPI